MATEKKDTPKYNVGDFILDVGKPSVADLIYLKLYIVIGDSVMNHYPVLEMKQVEEKLYTTTGSPIFLNIEENNHPYNMLVEDPTTKEETDFTKKKWIDPTITEKNKIGGTVLLFALKDFVDKHGPLINKQKEKEKRGEKEEDIDDPKQFLLKMMKSQRF
jgi:hypothetical protein